MALVNATLYLNDVDYEIISLSVKLTAAIYLPDNLRYLEMI